RKLVCRSQPFDEGLPVDRQWLKPGRQVFCRLSKQVQVILKPETPSRANLENCGNRRVVSRVCLQKESCFVEHCHPAAGGVCSRRGSLCVNRRICLHKDSCLHLERELLPLPIFKHCGNALWQFTAAEFGKCCRQVGRRLAAPEQFRRAASFHTQLEDIICPFKRKERQQLEKLREWRSRLYNEGAVGLSQKTLPAGHRCRFAAPEHPADLRIQGKRVEWPCEDAEFDKSFHVEF